MITATRSYLEGIITALGEQEGIVFKEDTSWFTDVEKKELHYNPHDLLSMQYLEAKGIMLHETAHCLFTEPIGDQSELEKQFTNDMRAIYNIFEDIRVEKKMHRKLGEFFTESQQRIEENTFIAIYHELYQTRKIFEPENRLTQALLVTISLCEENQGGSGIINSYTSHFVEQSSKDIAEKLEELEELGYRVKTLSSTREMRDFVDTFVYPLLKEYIHPDSPQNPDIEMLMKIAGKGPAENEERLDEIPPDKDILSLYHPYIVTMTHKLEAILKERLAVRYTGNYKRGRLLSKNVYKVIIPEVRRLFSRKNKAQKPNYVVTFVLDESGSMAGQRHVYAYIGALVLDEVCRRLGFTRKTFIFNGRHRTGTIQKYRDFHSGDNNEIGVLEAVGKSLNLEDDNIVFMITDGGVGKSPRPLLEEMEKKGITIIGIGIGMSETELQTHYPHYVCVESPEKMPKELLKLLKTIIHR